MHINQVYYGFLIVRCGFCTLAAHKQLRNSGEFKFVFELALKAALVVQQGHHPLFTVLRKAVKEHLNCLLGEGNVVDECIIRVVFVVLQKRWAFVKGAEVSDRVFPRAAFELRSVDVNRIQLLTAQTFEFDDVLEDAI